MPIIIEQLIGGQMEQVAEANSSGIPIFEDHSTDTVRATAFLHKPDGLETGVVEAECSAHELLSAFHDMRQAIKQRILVTLHDGESHELNITDQAGQTQQYRITHRVALKVLEEVDPGLLAKAKENPLTSWLSFEAFLNQCLLPLKLQPAFTEILLILGEMHQPPLPTEMQGFGAKANAICKKHNLNGEEGHMLMILTSAIVDQWSAFCREAQRAPEC